MPDKNDQLSTEECLKCEGEGSYMKESFIIDWNHGGEPTEELKDCELCFGTGEVSEEINAIYKMWL